MKDPVDPTQSTSPEFSRGAFVGISVAAGAAAATGAAMAETLGRTHPPLVAPDDPGIVARSISLKRPDTTIDAYAAWPVHAHAATPTLVVVMHIWGVDTSIRDVVRRYAKAGFVAIAPNLYSRFKAPSGDGVSDIAVFRPYYQQLDRQQYDGDIRAAAEWAKERSPKAKTGVTGFCMGGHIVLQQAIDNGKVFATAAPFYGAVDGIEPDFVDVPICGSYGERDTSIPAAGVRAFQAALHVPNDIRIYPTAGHAFFDDQRASYVAVAAHDAWTRTLAFLTKYVGAPTP